MLESTPTIDGETTSRVALTYDALLQSLIALHGRLMFHQSGGRCDGSSPMCYPQGEFRTVAAAILLGTFTLPDLDSSLADHAGTDGDAVSDDDGATLDCWMSREQCEVWKHTHLTVDAIDGRDSGFSLEAPEGKCFLIRFDPPA